MTNSHGDRERSRLSELLNKNRESLLSHEDKERLEGICEEIKREWAPPARSPYPYPPHDDTHCERVE